MDSDRLIPPAARHFGCSPPTLRVPCVGVGNLATNAMTAPESPMVETL